MLGTGLSQAIEIVVPAVCARRRHGHAAREFASVTEHTDLCEVEEWLSELRPSEPKYAMIRTGGGLKAEGLYKIFEGKTGSRLTLSAWGRRMNQLTRRQSMPLSPKRKVSSGTVYPIR